MAPRRLLGSALVALGAAALPLACGPSFQAIYEGNARFEHCYALEENPQAPMPAKSDCWRDWSEHYTYGQTRDRIHYAIARYVALSSAPNAPTDEAMMMAAPGVTPRVSNITAPAPTNAFAPPPKVFSGDASPPEERRADAGGPGAPAESRAFVKETTSTLPGRVCAEACGLTFDDCARKASLDAGGGDGGKARAASSNDAEPCSQAYKTCMRVCFR